MDKYRTKSLDAQAIIYLNTDFTTNAQIDSIVLCDSYIYTEFDFVSKPYRIWNEKKNIKLRKKKKKKEKCLWRSQTFGRPCIYNTTTYKLIHFALFQGNSGRNSVSSCLTARSSDSHTWIWYTNCALLLTSSRSLCALSFSHRLDLHDRNMFEWSSISTSFPNTSIPIQSSGDLRMVWDSPYTKEHQEWHFHCGSKTYYNNSKKGQSTHSCHNCLVM